MTSKMKYPFCLAILVFLILFPYMPHCEAGLSTATSKAAARKILKGGFNPSKMKAGDRFGKAAYMSSSARTALKEKPKAGAVVRFKESKYFQKYILDVRNPKPAQVKSITGAKDLRGMVHKRVIGSKLGHRLASVASKEGKSIKYRSARDPKGTNIAIPKKVYESHPKIVKPYKIAGAAN